MNWNYLNPNWLASRLLEKCGITTYLGRTEFAAHIFAGATFAFGAVVWNAWWMPAGWAAWTLIDEFYFDKNWECFITGKPWKDLVIDLASKLAGPVAYLSWRVW